jgi:hypothetical protein
MKTATAVIEAVLVTALGAAFLTFIGLCFGLGFHLSSRLV